MAADSGWVAIGTDHDTAAFAVASVRRCPRGRKTHLAGLAGPPVRVRVTRKDSELAVDAGDCRRAERRVSLLDA